MSKKKRVKRSLPRRDRHDAQGQSYQAIYKADHWNISDEDKANADRLSKEISRLSERLVRKTGKDYFIIGYRKVVVSKSTIRSMLNVPIPGHEHSWDESDLIFELSRIFTKQGELQNPGPHVLGNMQAARGLYIAECDHALATRIFKIIYYTAPDGSRARGGEKWFNFFLIEAIDMTTFRSVVENSSDKTERLEEFFTLTKDFQWHEEVIRRSKAWEMYQVRWTSPKYWSARPYEGIQTVNPKAFECFESDAAIFLKDLERRSGIAPSLSDPAVHAIVSSAASKIFSSHEPHPQFVVPRFGRNTKIKGRPRPLF